MTENKDPYIPVECGVHSEYELAIMHKTMLKLVWNDQHGNQRQASLIPVDIRTMDKKEYLIARTPEGDSEQIRLDKILQSNVKEAIKL
jgi:Rho-binding antiterminator